MNNKFIAFVIGVSLLVILGAIAAVVTSSNISTISVIHEDELVVKIDNEEAPGIGATVFKPDTCLVYVGLFDKKLHLKRKK